MNLLLSSSFYTFGNKIDTIPGLDLGQKNVVCVVTASLGEVDASWLEPEILQIRKRSKQFDTYDITGKSPKDLDADFQRYDVIYVAGGNTYFLLEKVKKSGFDHVIRRKLEQGNFYFGSSAGAILACPRIDFIESMDDPSKANLKDYAGLSLVDFLILPHTDSPFYGEETQKIAKKLSSGFERIIGLRDDQALYLQGRYMEIF